MTTLTALLENVRPERIKGRCREKKKLTERIVRRNIGCWSGEKGEEPNLKTTNVTSLVEGGGAYKRMKVGVK